MGQKDFRSDEVAAASRYCFTPLRETLECASTMAAFVNVALKQI
jgi:hypothetical protein